MYFATPDLEIKHIMKDIRIFLTQYGCEISIKGKPVLVIDISGAIKTANPHQDVNFEKESNSSFSNALCAIAAAHRYLAFTS